VNDAEGAEDKETNEAAVEEAQMVSSQADLAPLGASAGRTLVEEEIEEEEADIAQYMEDLAEDETFDEMEEETRAAEDLRETSSREIAPAGGPPSGISQPLSAEPQAGAEGAELSNGDEPVDEAAEDEAELEEAQAEAEALLDAEASGDARPAAMALRMLGSRFELRPRLPLIRSVLSVLHMIASAAEVSVAAEAGAASAVRTLPPSRLPTF
jgi:hypothetical protein